MKRTTEQVFAALRIEGGILPAEFLQRVSALNAPAQKEPDYDIRKGLNLKDEIGRYWRISSAIWQDYRDQRQREDRKPDVVGVHGWLVPLLTEVLGYSDLQSGTTVAIGDRRFPISHRAAAGAVPLVLTTLKFDLDRADTRFGDDGRRRAPHALIQEYLNADTACLWGIVGNGTTLRLVRDSPSLTRPAYVEVDLERMFDEQLFSDFAAFWLIFHASRLAPRNGNAAECILETWRLEGQKTGDRALANLRIGVTSALRQLGTGFIQHPTNGPLRDRLKSGEITAQAFFQELLRLVYRLLLLFTAEERDLLLDPNATPSARELYQRGYSLARLRERARLRRNYDGYADLWQGLQVTFRGLMRGAQPLGLPPLGGLFADDQCVILDSSAMPNDKLLTAIHALAFFQTGGMLSRVNYRDMGTEELGSVYESLLELHPLVSVETTPWTFSFAGDEKEGAMAKGAERKLSGSYYTPDSLVQELLRSALDPLIGRTVRENPTDPRNALLRLKVLDPACGSGHFLLGAARRLAAEVARLDSDGDLPNEALRRHALREVVRRCIFGVDRNPLSVELCKTALWIEAIEPGKPLTFLDAHIRCGDALVGVTDLSVLAKGIPDDAFTAFVGDDPAMVMALKRMNRAQREAPAMTLDLGATIPSDFATGLDALSQEDDDSIEAVEQKRMRFEALRSGGSGWHLKIACNLWTAAFFAKKVVADIKGRELCPTTDTVWRYLRGTTLYGPLVGETDRLSEHYRFFHWPLEFPDVARNGGFDIILGNPPWETTSPDAKEFFAAYDPQVRFMGNDEQKAAYARLKEYPGIAERWDTYCRELYTQTSFYKTSGRYWMFAPGNLGKGDLNIYRMFVETALDGVRAGGCATQLVPEGLYNGANAAAIRASLFERFRLERLIGFENSRGVWFPAVDTRAKFCLYAAWRDGTTNAFCAAFRVNSEARLAEMAEGRTLSVPVMLVREFSPDAVAVMEFAAQTDIDICRTMYELYPKFGERVAGKPNRVYMREVDMGTDRDLFTESPDGLPVFEGRMIDQFDYRAKGYSSGRGRAADWRDLPFGSASKIVSPQWRVPHHKVPDKLRDRIKQYRIAYCKVGSPTNQRTLIAALVPPTSICGDIIPTILFSHGEVADTLLWLGIANSMTMDFLVRKKSALHVTYTIMDTLPFPRDWRAIPAAEAIISRAYALSAVGAEMEDFRQTAPGSPGVPTDTEPVEDPNTRAQLMAEIEVLVAREVYGLTHNALRYILDPDNILGPNCGVETFKALRNRETRTYREYRTQRLVLEAWDRLSAAGVVNEFVN